MTTAAIPNEVRVYELMEMAYNEPGGCTVLGWADDMVVTVVKDRDLPVTFAVTPAPVRSHEDEVLVNAIRVPHPDEMSLEEVVQEGYYMPMGSIIEHELADPIIDRDDEPS